MDANTSSFAADSKLHFLDYWRVIRIRKTVIIAVLLLVVITVTAVTYILPESYRSTVRISVDKDTSDIAALGQAQGFRRLRPLLHPNRVRKDQIQAGALRRH